jgi:GDP-4-dehydro-6-deoxy-D-mannose reductase
VDVRPRERPRSDGPTLVTGATGFAGRHLLDRLAADADRPVVAWHRPGGHPPDRERPVSWRAVDLTDANAVARAVAHDQPARLYHLAGAPNVASSWQRPAAHLRANALGTHHLLRAVRRAAPDCRVLVVSSAQIYQPSDDPIREDAPLVPVNPYGISKLAEDQLALRAAADEGLDVVVARPFNHAGPGQAPAFAVSHFARQIARIEAGLESPTLGTGNLDARRDLTDVRDVVDAYCRMMARGPRGRAYNVCSGRAWRIGDLLSELLQLSRTEVVVETDRAHLRPNDVPIVQGDATRIRSELGWTPAIPVEQTLADTLAWWRTQPHAS